MTRRLAAVAAVALTLSAGTALAQSAVAWGQNSYGELGDGTVTFRRSPIPMTEMPGRVTAVAAGGTHSLAVRNGVLYSWGRNLWGALGDGSSALIGHRTPAPVIGLPGGVTLAASCRDRSLAIANGGAYAWGHYPLGNGTSDNQSALPVPVYGLSTGVTAVALGPTHGMAVKDGTLYSWGFNNAGQLGDGTNIQRLSPVPVVGFSSGVTAIAAGGLGSLAVRDGALYAWGDTVTGHPTPVDGLSSGVTAIAVGDSHKLAVKDGVVYAWGNNQHGQIGDGTNIGVRPSPVEVPGPSGIVAVTIAGWSSFALAGDGSLWVWGWNWSGELGLGTSTLDVRTPQHLLPPTGYRFTTVAGGDDLSMGYNGHVVGIVVPVCVADLDDGSGAGVRDAAITVEDLIYFLVGFEAGDVAIDLDDGSGTGVPDGTVTIDDLLFFLAHFEAGC